MKGISVIIPFYNASKNIKRLFDSIFEYFNNQNFEFIFIDDCSNDESSSIIINNTNGINNVKLLHNKKNLGAGLSRNQGIDISLFDYLMFLDSDDSLEKDALFILYNKCKDNKLDCLLFDYKRIGKNKRKIYKTIEHAKEGLICFDDVVLKSSSSVCGKVYRSEIIKKNEVVFPNFKRYEDFAFEQQVFSFCNVFYYLEQPLYNYYQNPDSITNNYNYKDFRYPFLSYQYIKERIDFKQDNFELYYAVFIKEVIYGLIRFKHQTEFNLEIKNYIRLTFFTIDIKKFIFTKTFKKLNMKSKIAYYLYLLKQN